MSPQVADPAPKRRRLSVKSPNPSIPPPSPSPPPVVLPTRPSLPPLWVGVDEATFEESTHRRQYRLIYNRFMSWWLKSSPDWVVVQGCSCTEELWNLGRKDYQSLSQRQKNILLRHFLHRSSAPAWVFDFAVRAWPCDICEKSEEPILRAQTCFLTYQGDWGVVETPSTLPEDVLCQELTMAVREMPEAQGLWAEFLAFAETLAKDLQATSWACCQEICLQTWEEQRQLRLHFHLFMKSDVKQMRCKSRQRLRFQGADPFLKDTMWGKKVFKSNWAGAYYCLAPKKGSEQ